MNRADSLKKEKEGKSERFQIQEGFDLGLLTEGGRGYRRGVWAASAN